MDFKLFVIGLLLLPIILANDVPSFIYDQQKKYHDPVLAALSSYGTIHHPYFGPPPGPYYGPPAGQYFGPPPGTYFGPGYKSYLGQHPSIYFKPFFAGYKPYYGPYFSGPPTGSYPSYPGYPQGYYPAGSSSQSDSETTE